MLRNRARKEREEKEAKESASVTELKEEDGSSKGPKDVLVKGTKQGWVQFDVRRSWRRGAEGEEVSLFARDKSWLFWDVVESQCGGGQYSPSLPHPPSRAFASQGRVDPTDALSPFLTSLRRPDPSPHSTLPPPPSLNPPPSAVPPPPNPPPDPHPHLPLPHPPSPATARNARDDLDPPLHSRATSPSPRFLRAAPRLAHGASQLAGGGFLRERAA